LCFVTNFKKLIKVRTHFCFAKFVAFVGKNFDYSPSLINLFNELSFNLEVLLDSIISATLVTAFKASDSMLRLRFKNFS